jgi:hypothetical protein
MFIPASKTLIYAGEVSDVTGEGKSDFPSIA